MLKTLSLQEANGLLPLLREYHFRLNALLIHLQRLRRHFEKKHARRLVLDPKAEQITLIEKKMRGKKHQGLLQEIGEVEDLIGDEISDLMRFGAVVRSLYPLHIDFFSIRNQAPVFLCWHGEEDEIKHWHHLDDGAPFRQIIEPEKGCGPLMVH